MESDDIEIKMVAERIRVLLKEYHMELDVEETDDGSYYINLVRSDQPEEGHAHGYH
jgi:hypothetical protein